MFFTLALPTILLILSVIGGYEPSTPYQPSKKRKTSALRPTAGPSTAKARTTRQRKPSSEPTMVVEDDDDDVAEVVQPKSKRRGRGALSVPATNGKAPKGKGKANSMVNGHKNDADLVIIDEPDDEKPSLAMPPSPTKKGKTRTGPPFLVEEGEIVEETGPASSPELERMREERDLVRPLPAPQYNCSKLLNTVGQYKAKSEELSESMLQLIKAKNTEPEEELAARKAQYDAAIGGARLLINHFPVHLHRL